MSLTEEPGKTRRREAERRLIACELHDVVLQDLMGALEAPHATG